MLRNFAIAAAVLVLGTAVLMAPIEVEDTLTLPGRVEPLREWTLVRSQTDAVESMVRNHLDGSVETYAINRFERGDAIRIDLAHAALGDAISVGDTVATMFSNEIERQIVALAGNLAAARATLESLSTGAKAEIIETEQRLLAQAEARATQQAATLERLRQLHAQGAIPDEELDIAENEQRVLQADIAVAEARIADAQTGAKPEDQAVLRTQIAAFENELDALRSRQQRFIITAPMDGVAARATGPDTLLTVRATTGTLITMPIREADHARLQRGQIVQLTGPGLPAPLDATLARLGDEVHTIGRDQVLLIAAIAEDAPPTLLPGTRVSATIDFGAVPLRQAAWELLLSMFR